MLRWKKSGRSRTSQTVLKKPSLDELQDDGGLKSDVSPELDVILDIPVTISMEVGNTDITIRNLLQLNQGSVIELERLAGDPLDVSGQWNAYCSRRSGGGQ